jgi:YggT family protein
MDFASVANVADLVVRALALGMVGVAGVVALTHWAVRTKRIGPFSGWSRTVRRIGDPVLRPLERRMLRAGASPDSASYWLFGLAILAALLLISAVRWIFGFVYGIAALSTAGPRAWLVAAVDSIFWILMAALFVRVISGWLGVSPYRPAMRPVYWLTEWLLRPIRRLLPRTGMIDLSPLVAYFALVALHLIAGILLSAAR